MSQPNTIYLKDYLPPQYSAKQVSLEFTLDDTGCHLVSHVDYEIQGSDHTLVLNGDADILTLVSIALDGQIVPDSHYTLEGDQLILTDLPDGFKLSIETQFDPKKNTKLSGLYQSQGNYCTQCESHGFRRMTYFQDRPDVLSIYTTSITAPANHFNAMLSNGNLISDQTSAGLRTVIWHDPFPKPCYLFAMVCGEFEQLSTQYTTRSGRDVTVQLYLEPGCLGQGQFALDSIIDSMKWDEETFDREYDLDLFMVVSVSDFNYGAMENKGLNVFNNKYILASPQTATDQDYINVHAVIGHEYFHNWSGNRVTCRDWFQLSLKEGLTVFRDQSFTMDRYSKGVKRLNDAAIIRQFQFAQDSGPMAHPIQPPSYIEVNNFYTVTVYNKGAEVIRMIQTILGVDAFRKALNDYFETFDGQAVTCDDFVAIMAKSSGVSLDQFKLWYTQAGTPQVQVSYQYNKSENSMVLDMTQAIPDTPEQTHKKPMVLPIRVSFLDDHGTIVNAQYNGERAKEHLCLMTDKEQTFTFTGFDSEAIPSVLRDFSAPVALSIPLDARQRAVLMQYETDPYAAWQAAHGWMSELIMHHANDAQAIAGLASVMTSLLQDHAKSDTYFLADLLVLPSLGALIEEHKPVDIQVLKANHQAVQQSLAALLSETAEKAYQTLTSQITAYEPSLEAMGVRKLRQVCLYWLAVAEHQNFETYAKAQFETADNLTDQLAVLSALNRKPSELRNALMDAFYQDAQASDLVMDRWFQLQASMGDASVLAQVEALISHESFHWSNPNRVRSLLGVFGANPYGFHQNDASGYAFLLAQIIHLDKLNPQVASRLFDPLLHWEKYQGNTKQMMHSCLKSIDLDTISDDLFELVTKALAEAS